MYYTVKDLENLNLKKEWLYGYNREQVNTVLSRVAEDYRELCEENNDLSAQLTIMRETVQHYKTIEESLQHTLLIAHNTSESIKMNATEKAANIIREAEIKAQQIVEGAREQVGKIDTEYEDIKKNLKTYKLKSQTLLNTLQEMLKQSVEEDEK